MALLIIINCTFIGIKNIFFLSMNLCILRCVIFSVLPGQAVCFYLFYFFLPRCLTFLSIRILNKVINKHTNCYLKADDTLLKITIRGLLIETLEVLSVPRMR